MSYYGWGPPEATHAERLKLTREAFDLISQDSSYQDFNLTGQSDQKKFMAWWASRKLFGKDILHIYQQTGSCVGASMGNIINYAQCIEIAAGDREEFKYNFFPYHYGAGRMLGGSPSKGEGSWGVYQSQAILKYGTIFEDSGSLPQYKKTDIDLILTENDEYDWSGPDRDRTWDFQKFTEIGTQHVFEQSSRITSFQKAAEAVLNGYLIQICSNVGYNRRSSDGFNYPGPTWNHAMSLIGVDLQYKIPYGIILNNWSDSHGRMTDFETDEQYPIGLLRVRAEHIDQMLRQGDSYVYSAYKGYPARKLDRSFFNLV